MDVGTKDVVIILSLLEGIVLIFETVENLPGRLLKNLHLKCYIPA